MPSINQVKLLNIVNDLIAALNTLASDDIGLNPSRIKNKIIPILNDIYNNLNSYGNADDTAISDAKEKILDCLSTPDLIKEVERYAEKHEQHKNYDNKDTRSYVDTAKAYSNFLEVVDRLNKINQQEINPLVETPQSATPRLSLKR